MSSPPPLPTSSSLRLRPLDDSRLYFCKCPTHCAEWAQHPLGNPLRAMFYDLHRVQEVVRLQPLFAQGYHPKTRHARLAPPYKLLADYASRQGHFLQAVGGQACERGLQCYLGWSELTNIDRRAALTVRGKC